MAFLDRLTLGKKIASLLAAGLVIGIGVFSFLGINAVNQATDAMLADRLTTAHLIVGYMDDALEKAQTELAITAGKMGAGPEDAEPEAHLPSLRELHPQPP